jgi:hypothetical protein
MDFEEPRRQLISALSEGKTIKSSLPVWLAAIRTKLSYTPGSVPKPEALYELGGQLREIFALTKPSSSSPPSAGGDSRSQDNLQGAGVAWEFLVVWYLNLLSIGSNIWLTKKKKGYYPEVLEEAFTTSIGTYESKSEPDILAFAIPTNYTNGVPNSAARRFRINAELKNFIISADDLVRAHVSQVTASIIQCKSNWNDSVQTVQLWGILYDESRKNEPKIPESITVGGSYHPGSFKDFSFAFVTVPSQKDLTKFNANRAEVVRVRSLSGGNYWGAPKQKNIADSVDRYLYRNFRSFLPSSPADHAKLLARHMKSLDHFLSLDL